MANFEKSDIFIIKFLAKFGSNQIFYIQLNFDFERI